ncbi:hypothetical protein [Raoultella ornithinolytica]|uniref:hypothetical protein n=1 Tax=Raoultella ornithinolytica TaxID=54291 RepID=UPI001F261FD8|nr:hypothetical protein [Raoultella ornithinolytica]MCF1303371.1 hypothetical protein [Raoultella ornithinolytica]
MDIFGLFWILLSSIFIFLRYEYIFTLLIVSSLFQSGVAFKFGGSGLPVFYFIEILTIIKFSLPSRHNGFINFFNKDSFKIFSYILIIWFLTYLNTVLFSGIKVFSPAFSFEYNYYVKGVPLAFSSGNINQLVLITFNLITLYVFYKRRNLLSPDDAMRAIIISVIIFSSYCFIWIINKPFASIIEGVMYNAEHNANAVFESRLSGTFGEPSFAGIFIGSLIPPLFFSNKKILKIISVMMLFFLYKNASTSGIFTFMVSLSLSFCIRGNLVKNALAIISIIIFSGLIYFSFETYITEYISNKSETGSGIVRQASNLNALNILVDTFGLGAGVGSARISSLLFSVLANFGLWATIYLVYIIVSFIRKSENVFSHSKKTLIMVLISAVLGSCSANPDYSYAFIWGLIFCCMLTGENKKK